MIGNKHENLIGATLAIYPSPHNLEYERNHMRYIEEVREEFFRIPTKIFFSIYLSPVVYRDIFENLKHGLLSEKICIEFDDDPLLSIFKRVDAPDDKKEALEYGWEPDGSGMIWHNKEKENQVIPIAEIQFHYAVVQARYDETTYQLLPRVPDVPSGLINQQIASIQMIVAEMSKQLRWAALGIIAVAAMFASWVLRH